MSTVTDLLVRGHPRFTDPSLQAIESNQGAEAAWLEALQRPLADIVGSTQGHFSLGARLASGHAMIAVDRFASETMCYSATEGRLRFSERADRLADEGSELDLQALFDYLYFHTIPAPRTVYKGVHRLPAGHCAWSDEQGVHLQRYWQPSFAERATDFASARAEFHKLLREAVQQALGGEQPACFLSGGTDSSTVAGVLAEVSGQRPITLSVGFEAEGYDEMEYARIAARHFQTDHREHYITPADLVALIPKVAADQDQPFGNSSALPTYFCALQAQRAGITRLLAGDGGDELFGGNTRYGKQRVFAAYDLIPPTMRRAFLEPMTDRRLVDAIPGLRKGASYVRQARVPMPDRLQTYNLLERLGVDQVLTPGFLAQVDPASPLKGQRATWSESEGASFVNRMLAFDWRYTLAENDLPKVRGGTRLAGVAVAYPLLDQAIVDFSSRLPSDYKLRRLKLRWFFKEALKGFLPDAIITKKKHGFGLPFGPWATKDPALRAMARDSVRGLGARGIVRPAFTTSLVDDILPTHPGFYGEMVWILMMLEQWFRHHRPDFRLDA